MKAVQMIEPSNQGNIRMWMPGIINSQIFKSQFFNLLGWD